jgi:ribosomal protein S6--L-glutamate ligase
LKSKTIIADNDTLHAQFELLGQDHCFIGRVRVKPYEEFIVTDLERRGVTLFPSGLSQQLSRSKIRQGRLLGEYMIPHTMVIFDQHDLLHGVNRYTENNIGKVVTKDDRKNGGMGIHLWHSVEDVFNQATLSVLPYPFVLQPFIADCRDIRVLKFGDYSENYERYNPTNFRNNLHCGGTPAPCELTAEQEGICKKVMTRGDFPYGHIDLMVTPDGTTYLAEINLRGGLRGACISTPAYKKMLADIHLHFRESVT